MTRRRLPIAIVALLVGLAVPAVALAHPLGNFTINHYAGIRVSPDVIRLDVVIDMAEIPAFQERQRLDTDGDGTVGPAETAAERAVACDRLLPSLNLAVDSARQALTTTAAGLSFPPGAGGLVTMRLVCQLEARPATPLSVAAAITFSDASFAERIGWREVVVMGDGATIAGADLPAASVSNRLTVYPSDLLSQPLDMRSVTFGASPGGASLAPWSAPDASTLEGPGGYEPDARGAAAEPESVPGIGAVPGGIKDELASLIGTDDLTLPVILASLLVAMGLGAVHAVSPGHGKTVMAAYLVGSAGTARHAVALGFTVTIAHTLGVLALAGVTIVASRVLPPERLYPLLGLLSGAIVIAIGAWLLAGRYRAWVDGREQARAHEGEHQHRHEHRHDERAAGDHSHGGVRHSHQPSQGTTLSWRSLFALGLSGGLVPSASALILLLGSIAAGRLEYGLVLVIAFGVGMAIVLGGVGLALVYASSLLERFSSGHRVRGLASVVPAATALIVIAAGVFLTGQALTQTF
jgi:ABC-type nickel/cobalt efflux system permease component RcnA